MNTVLFPRTDRSSPRARQRGQAITEMAVIAAVLVPLFLLVPVLAKYVHVRQTTQQTARAAAWQATVSSGYQLPDIARQQQLLIDRHFGDARAPIQSQPSAASPENRVGNVMFNTFSNRTLIERGDVQLEGYDNTSATGLMSTAMGWLSRIPGAWSTPNANGLVTAHLAVTPQNLRTSDGQPAAYLAPFDNINLRFAGSQSLLADPWNASGPSGNARSVLNQVTPLVPTAMITSCEVQPEIVDGLSLPNLCPFTKIHDRLNVEPINDIPIIGAPLRLQLGLIEPDVVPQDKLRSDVP